MDLESNKNDYIRLDNNPIANGLLPKEDLLLDHLEYDCF